jgi:dephospho-CoA kinase
MLLVGLTGNYGMGKSAVLKMFQKLGAVTYDADEIVASLLRKETVLKKITDIFGDVIIRADGSLDKKKLADIIFVDATLRRSLEDILHPLIFKEIDRLLEREENKGSIAIVEAPLLFERHYEAKFQRLITVATGQEKALERLEKTGITREEALQRIHSQLPIEEKISRSDFTINNDGSPEETELQVKNIYNNLLREGHDGDRCRSRSLRENLS